MYIDCINISAWNKIFVVYSIGQMLECVAALFTQSNQE